MYATVPGRPLCLAILLFLTAMAAAAQTTDEPPTPPLHRISLDASFNGEDAFVGTTYSFRVLLRPHLAVAVEGWVRPYEKAVLVQESDDVYYRLQETRFGAGLGVDFVLPTGLLPYLFVSGFVERSWSSYAGTEREAAETVFPVFRVGAGIPFGEQAEGEFAMGLRLGYQYSEFTDLTRHRAYVGLEFTF